MPSLILFSPQTHLWLAGTHRPHPEYVREIKRLIETLGLTNPVTLIPSAPDSVLMALYMNADLFLSMSTEEGFNSTLIEAMWFDVSVFAFSSSAVAETLGEAGFVFDDKQDTHQLAREIVVILTDSNIRRRMINLQQKQREKHHPQKGASLVKEMLSMAMGQS